MTTRAVIFDLDGTLVHSAPDLHAAASAMLSDLGRAPVTLRQVTGFVGNGVPRLVQRCLSATGGVPDDGGRGALQLFSDHYGRHPTRLTRPYPGVPEMLDRLAGAGMALGICTNKPQAATFQVLGGLGIARHFASVVGGDVLTVHKPDPAPLLAVLDALGAARNQTLFVGDSETDAATAQAAGVPFALFTGGYRKTGLSDLPHDWAFNRHDQLCARVLAPA